MNLKSHLNSVLFRNVIHGNTLESKYNPQFDTRYNRYINRYSSLKSFRKTKHTVYLHHPYLHGIEQ